MSADASLDSYMLLERAPGLALVLNTPKVHKANILPAQISLFSSNWPYRDEVTGKVATTQAVVLGLGAMFNHSSHDQNVGWKRNIEGGTIIYTSLRDIKMGEELCISYGSWLTFVDAEPTIEDARSVDGNDLDVFNRIDLDS
ncbi:MAG: hypothetical protein M1827_002864 [Pycnora praestabilis]|nr:MAG: hypothetical protein M1827_002864 [Pycnora praestabilis]